MQEKLAIKKIANGVIEGILESVSSIIYSSSRQKKLKKHLNKLQDDFISTLSDKQKKDYELLMDMKIDIESSDQIFDILYGMKVQKVFDYITDNIWEVINYYESKGTPIEKMYNLK